MFKKPGINVGGGVYNSPMKKKNKPFGMRTEARRKAEAEVVFRAMLLNPHLVVETKKHKGSRMANKAKAIRESND